MKLIGSKTVFIQVERACNSENLVSTCHLLDDNWDVGMSIIADVSSYIIREAYCQAHRSPDNLFLGQDKIDELNGLSCYIDGKKDGNCLLNRVEGSTKKYLFDQCVNGFIQGETCIYAERGHESKEAYNAYWDEVEKEGCRMYSYKNSEDLPWMEYALPINSSGMLFHREKKSLLFKKKGEGIWQAIGHLKDSYHEMLIVLDIDLEDKNIIGCDIEIKVAPGISCFENSIHQSKLINRNIGDINKIDLVGIVGRAEGCYHLVDIGWDLISLIKDKLKNPANKQGGQL